MPSNSKKIYEICMPIANLPPHKLKKKGLSDEKYYIKFLRGK